MNKTQMKIATEYLDERWDIVENLADSDSYEVNKAVYDGAVRMLLHMGFGVNRKANGTHIIEK